MASKTFNKLEKYETSVKVYYLGMEQDKLVEKVCGAPESRVDGTRDGTGRDGTGRDGTGRGLVGQ